MIDNYLLEELVAFNKNKTLAKTAKQLLITQLTVTRGLQKLEEELGVQLFDRQPNKILLTKTGELAAQKAEQLLTANKNFVTQIRNYAENQRVIRIGTVAPGPLYVAKEVAKDFAMKIDNQFIQSQDVTKKLQELQYSLIFSQKEIQTEQIESVYVGQERLSVHLDKFMYLANQRSITFEELKGLSFVVMDDIGPWKTIVQDNIPNAKFLYQAQRDSLNEITKYTKFPYFTTNITNLTDESKISDIDRVQIPITDSTAAMPFYASYLKIQHPRLKPIVKRIIEIWPQ